MKSHPVKCPDKLYRFTAACLTLLLSATVLCAADAFEDTYDKARQYFRQGNYEDALRLFKKANSLKNNTDLDCLWGIAESYSKLGGHKNVLQLCDQLIQLSSEDPGMMVKAWNLKGLSLYSVYTQDPAKKHEDKLLDAEVAFRQVLNIHPGQNMAHYNLGLTLLRLERLDEGLRELQLFISSGDADETLLKKAGRYLEAPHLVGKDLAPDFSFLTMDGEYLSSDDLRGKVLLLDFWGTWCAPCRSALPFLTRLAKKFSKDQFMLISVDANDPEGVWRDFVAQNQMDWTNTHDSNSKVRRAFQVNAFPTYILIDHEGAILQRTMGNRDEGAMDGLIKKALKQVDIAVRKPVSLPSAIKPAPPSGPFSSPDSKGYMLRIPKPVVEVIENSVRTNEFQSSTKLLSLRIRNWASLPDELFTSARNMQPCSSGFPITMTGSEPSRLEVIVSDEQGQVIRSMCGPPTPQILQSLPLPLPQFLRTGRVVVTVKDRLTGQSVRSEPVPLSEK